MASIVNKQEEIRRTVLEHIPREAEITRVEFEGPSLAIYTKRPEIRITHNRAITDIKTLLWRRYIRALAFNVATVFCASATTPEIVIAR